jgi:hypothetical protein
MPGRCLDFARIKRRLIAAVVARETSGLLLLEPAKLRRNRRDVVSPTSGECDEG